LHWHSFGALTGRAAFVIDSYADGAGSTKGRLFGRVVLFHADDSDTTRSAAGRAAPGKRRVRARCCLIAA
jgi:hypothetical protein